MATENRGFSSDNNVTPIGGQVGGGGGVPFVANETHKINYENEDGSYSASGEIVSTSTISSKTRTVETITVS